MQFKCGTAYLLNLGLQAEKLYFLKYFYGILKLKFTYRSFYEIRCVLSTKPGKTFSPDIV